MLVYTVSYFRRLEPLPPPLWEDHILQDFTSWYSNWATGWTVEEPGFDYRQAQWLVLFFRVSGTDVGPTLPRIKWSPGVKRPDQEADYSPSFSVKVKNKWMYTSTPPRLYVAVLNSDQERLAKCISNILCLEWNQSGSVYLTFNISLCGMWRHVGWSTGIIVFEEPAPSIFLEEGQELWMASHPITEYAVAHSHRIAPKQWLTTDSGGCDSTPTREDSAVIATAFCPLVSESLSSQINL